MKAANDSGTGIADSKKPAKREKIVIGWRETICLPSWDSGKLVAKIDTGARTSALHVENLVEEQDVAHFELPTADGAVSITSPIVRLSVVRPTTGERQRRCVVRTSLELAGVTREIEVSLVSRIDMLVPMLIGRRALGTQFLVNPRSRYLHGRPD